MVTRQPVSWFLSDRGRKFTFAVITTTGIACASAKYVPNTFLLKRYRDVVHNYSQGKKAELPEEINEHFKKCFEILKFSDLHKLLISPFSVFGFDLFHAGSCKTRYGAVIGIPVNFKYKNIEDVQKDNIKVNQKDVDWASNAGKMLAESLTLPEKVQTFAICREMLMTDNYKVFLETFYPFISIQLIYSSAQYINNKFNLYSAPQRVRGTLYTILVIFGLGLYFLMKDVTEVYYETDVDTKLCELGQDFVESGVIFYSKLLQRNQALRELMGSEGERKYTKLGNENYIIRQPNIPLVHRKQFFEEKLETK